LEDARDAAGASVGAGGAPGRTHGGEAEIEKGIISAQDGRALLKVGGAMHMENGAADECPCERAGGEAAVGGGEQDEGEGAAGQRGGDAVNGAAEDGAADIGEQTPCAQGAADVPFTFGHDNTAVVEGVLHAFARVAACDDVVPCGGLEGEIFGADPISFGEVGKLQGFGRQTCLLNTHSVGGERRAEGEEHVQAKFRRGRGDAKLLQGIAQAACEAAGLKGIGGAQQMSKAERGNQTKDRA